MPGLETNNIPGGTVVESVGNATQQNNVDSISPDYTDWKTKSRLPRTLMEGTRGMKEAGNEYLPKDPLESTANYNNRLARSTLFNVFRKTTQFLSGLVFQSKLLMPDNRPGAYEEIFKNVDQKGNSLEVFCKRIFEKGLAEGVRHIYVCAPKEDVTNMTKAQAEEAGINPYPYFRDVAAVDVIAWIYDEETLELLQVRIREDTRVRIGDFGWKEVKKIRVLEKGKWAVYHRQDTDNVYKLESQGTNSITTIIPIATFIPGEEYTILTGETPFMDLAELNLSNWRSSSDQSNILHVARVPLLFSKFLDLKEIESSTASMINSDNEYGDLKFVEHGGQAIGAGQTDLDRNEVKMSLYGLQQVMDKPGSQTATEKTINTAESNSNLSMFVIEFESTLWQAMEWLQEYVGEDLDTEAIIVNRNFMTAALAAMDANVLLLAVEKNVLSRELVFKEFVRRGMIAEDADWTEVQEQITTDKQAAQSEMQDMLALTGGFDPAKGAPNDTGAENNTDKNADDEGATS